MSLERVFSTQSLQAIEITLRRGDVLIETGPVDNVKVSAELGSGSSEADLQFEEVPGALRIHQVGSTGVFGGLGPLGDFGLGQLGFPIGKVDVRVIVPTPAPRFSVTTGLGAVKVADWTGAVKVHSGKGEIDLGAGHGSVEVKSGVGPVKVGSFAERCEISTGMGDISVGFGSGMLSVQSGLGEVFLTDVTGEIDAQTGKGQITLERVFGNANLRTGFGQIQVRGARGLAVDAKTGKGELEFSGQFETIQARSGFGGVAIQSEDLRGPVDVTTGHGGIEVDLSPGIAIRIDAASRRGNVESQVPLVRVGQPGPEGFFSQRMVGTLGQADTKKTMRLRSGGGNIEIRISAEASTSASATPAAKPSPVEAEPAPADQATPSPAAPRAATEQTEKPLAESVARNLAEGPVAVESSRSNEAAPGLANLRPGPAQTPATPNGATDPRIRVLEALSRGEITVDEAERLLS